MNASPSAARSLVVVRGLDSAIRGLVRGKRRPDLVLVDDPQTRESAHSIVQTSSRIETLRRDIEGLVGPGQSLTIVMLVTIIAHGDLADRYTSDDEPSYRSMRFRALEKMPDRMDLVEEYIERVRRAQRSGDGTARAAHARYLLNRERNEAGALAGWEASFTTADVGDRAMEDAFKAARAIREASVRGGAA
ncbi:MAG: hypothetical protein ACYS9X_01405 [Planctomycetota bacterium]|jgi:hypothetical protein